MTADPHRTDPGDLADREGGDLPARLAAALHRGPGSSAVDPDAVRAGIRSRIHRARARRAVLVAAVVLVVVATLRWPGPGPQSLLEPAGDAAVATPTETPDHTPGPGDVLYPIPGGAMLRVTDAQQLGPEVRDLAAVDDTTQDRTVPTVPGQACRPSTRTGPAPVAGRSWGFLLQEGTTGNARVTQTVTGWPAGTGRQRFAEETRGEDGRCRWSTPQEGAGRPRLPAEAAQVGIDEAWAGSDVQADVFGTPVWGEVALTTRAAVRHDDLIVSIEIRRPLGDRSREDQLEQTVLLAIIATRQLLVADVGR